MAIVLQRHPRKITELFLEKIMRKIMALAATLTLATMACNDTKTQESDSTETNTGTTSETGTGDVIVYGEAYYTAYDGANDYSLMLLGERDNWTVKDPSIATIEEAEINLTTENLDALVQSEFDRVSPRMEERCNEDSTRPGCPFTLETFKENFEGRFRVQKITPLAAGVTQLVSEGRGPRQGQTRTKYLVITAKEAGAFDAGKERYTTNGTGSLQSCESCHLSGEENAPPHALGRVKDFSDAAILSWIKTGSSDGISASIPHSWEFSSDLQEVGIVPYLRSLQAKDVNSLTEQYIAEISGDFEDGIGGSTE